MVAARLAEVAHWRVLLLEAGGPPPPESVVPGLNVVLMQSDADWNYFTVRQNHSLKSYVGEVSMVVGILKTYQFSFNSYFNTHFHDAMRAQPFVRNEGIEH